MMPKKREYSDQIKTNLKSIMDHFDIEDRTVRERQIRLWKKMEYYWAGFQRLWWSEVAHDWRVFDTTGDLSGEMAYYDKPINVFRAYLESIIAALSVTVPPVKCLPDDADNPSDVNTAKGGTKIAELVYRHVDAPLLWIHALWVYCTQGMIAAYNYPSEDVKYGEVEVPNYEESEETVKQQVCPNCQKNLVDQDAIAREIDEFLPGSDDVKLHDLILNEGQAFCLNCMATVDPELTEQKVIVTRLAGITRKAKSRQCIEVYGGLYVKVPVYAHNQSECPYLKLSYETHFSNVLKKYPHLRDKTDKFAGKVTSSGGMYDPYERWGRLSPQYFGEYPLNTPTVTNLWLRPSAFEIISDEKQRAELYKEFPDGCKVVFINDEFACAENEALDDCWTLTYNPLSEYIHFDPHGLLVASVQEISNDLVSLVLQTIEHGIGQTFADPQVLNFKQYGETETAPGMIYPAQPRAGKSLGDAFYQAKTATLSAEVDPFAQKIQEMGQFASGALPSIWGGDQSGGSKTAAQYAMSRAQSLQRLQTPWKMLQFWWKGIFSKVIPAYIKTMIEDEKWSKEESGTFLSVVVKKVELDGKIGSVELEANDQLPLTWSQQKDVIMQLLQLGTPQIVEALTTPENAPLIAEAIGLTNFIIPGNDDREAEYEEIQVLVQAGPIPTPPTPQQPQGGKQSSIMPEFLVDNHRIRAEVDRQWLVSEVGRQAKVNNKEGYENVLLHLQAHVMMGQQQQMQQQMQQQPQQNTQKAPQGKPQAPPEQGATNVPGTAIH